MSMLLYVPCSKQKLLKGLIVCHLMSWSLGGSQSIALGTFACCQAECDSVSRGCELVELLRGLLRLLVTGWLQGVSHIVSLLFCAWSPSV